MNEEQNTNLQEQEDDYSGGLMEMSTGTQVGIAAGFVGLPLLAGAAEVLHLGFAGLVVGAVGVSAVGLVGKHVIDQQKANGRNIHIPVLDQFRNADWGALLRPVDEHGNMIVEQREVSSPAQAPESEPSVAPDHEQEDTEEALFEHRSARNEATLPRITVESIARHIERNSYDIYIGRSLTRPGNPAVKVNFYKRHVKLIGASQHGKSSMAAALLDVIIRTHDPERVQIALLDLEDKTSRLFANAPHILKVRAGGKLFPLHARSEEQVLEYLEHLLALVEYRYTLSEEEMEQEPLVIAYLEEFIDLKDYFKQRIDAVGKDEREQAKRDYARLVFCIKKIARRGLKVLVQLLMCAQVDYRDEDLQEALINVTSGMSFSVRVSAAQAAGFYQTELLQRNAREDKVGQAVVEMPDCKDLILAPDYDLKARLKALSKEIQARREREAPPIPVALRADEPSTPGTRRLYPVPRTRPFIEELQPRKEEQPEAELTEREQLYDDALNLWEHNIRGIRAMMGPLDLNFNQTRELLEEMEELGLIAWRKKSERANA